MLSTTNSLYPSYAVRNLGTLRGDNWRKLVAWVAELPGVHPEAMAFTLMTRRLRALLDESQSHAACNDTSCAVCAMEIFAAYEGTEKDLMDEYYRTLGEIESFVNRSPQPARVPVRVVVAA